jgi:hypothetical protein
MKRDLIDALTSPQSDPEFGKKYGITVLLTAGAVVVLPAIPLVGYLAQTMKHASAGKKGLPEWKGLADLTVQGGICLLAALYLLPAALLFAIGYLPLMMGGKGLLSLGTILNRFISFGALVILLGGLAFTLTGVDGYLRSREVGEIFNLKSILAKLKSHANEISMLLATSGAVWATLMVVNVVFGDWWLLSWGLIVVTVLIGALMNLAVAYGTGSIYSTPAAGETVDQLTAGEPAAALPPADAIELPPAEEEGEAEAEVWKPK